MIVRMSYCLPFSFVVDRDPGGLGKTAIFLGA